MKWIVSSIRTPAWKRASSERETRSRSEFPLIRSFITLLLSRILCLLVYAFNVSPKTFKRPTAAAMPRRASFDTACLPMLSSEGVSLLTSRVER